MDNKSKTIGFIGLGVMGKPMAKNLVKAGYRLVVYDVKPEPVAEMAALGTGTAASPAEVASRSDVIITMLPNSPHVINVISGENGILDGAGAGKVIIDMSSISPVVSKKMAALAAEKGMEMLDAPVSGGEPKAIDGTMSIMVGGKKEVFESVKDLLLTMGGSAVLIGDIGSGNIGSGSSGTGTTPGTAVNPGPAAGTGSGVTVGWVQVGSDWYYRNVSGAYSTGWVHDGSYWYYCDSTGKMQAGWLFDGTNWFYLNTVHDGTYGRMLTGWQNIDGNTYYLNPVSDGTQGAMYYGLRTIDGKNYYFNEAHDGTFGKLLFTL